MMEKLAKIINRLLDEAVKIASGVSLGAMITTFMLMKNLTVSIPYTIGIYLASISVTYIGLTIAKKRLDDLSRREKHEIYRINKSMDEVFTSKSMNIVHEHTIVFIDKIIKYTDDYELPTECLDAINQFLYMVNENYFDLIQEQNPTISRDIVIEKIIKEIVAYLKKYDQDFFDELDIEEALEHVFFINKKLRGKMYKEFKMSKRKIGKEIHYQVVSKNITDEMIEESFYEEPITKTDVMLGRLNLDNLNTYEYIIQELDQDENNFYNGYSLLEWDVEFLREVVTYMTYEFKEEIEAELEKFNEFELAVSFIANVGIYAILNRCTRVTIDEIIQTFKEWNYLSTELKIKILDMIFADINLPREIYPYQKITNRNVKRKIIEFPSKK